MSTIGTVVRHALHEAHGLVRPLLTGLTDDEYFWEPADGCWSVRPNRLPHPPELPGLLPGPSKPNTRPWRVEHGWAWSDEGTGGWTEAPRLTTIAWLLTHVAACQITYHQDAFDSGDRRFDDLVPTTASAATALFDEGAALLSDTLAALDDAELVVPWNRGKPLADRQSVVPGDPLWKMFVGLAQHAVHHGAEIGRMRDLYRELHPSP